MKLLIITQAIDIKHPVLGFFHRWVEEFAKHAEHIEVIALQTGEYNLPQNVVVHSLGKESKERTMIYHSAFSRLVYAFRFLILVIRLRKKYDSVFVHMNPEYIVLAGWWWRLTGKKIGLWYNHTVGSVWLKVVHPFVHSVFHTSPFAFTARYKNAVRMPAGINTDIFKPHPEVERIPQSIYFQGRVAPAKRVHIILEAFAVLHENGQAKLLTIVGPEDEKYIRPLKEKYASLVQSGAVVFKGPVPNTETPKLYASHSVSVNLTDDGNYDKTVLESLACGTPVIVSSKAFADASVYSISNPESRCLEVALLDAINANLKKDDLLVEYVKENHALAKLILDIKNIYKQPIQ